MSNPTPILSNSAAPAVAASAWHGQLQLEFRHRPDETWLSRSYAQAPLKVQRPFYPEGKAVCHVAILHTAGGIVGGDRLSLQVNLQPQAQALVTTPAAAKVYRSNGLPACQQTDLQVAESAYLEWLPQETIVFDGAIYHQALRVDLAPGAIWMGWEITRFGRSARGEQFDSGEWRSHTEVWQADRLLWVDPQYLRGGSEMLNSPHGLAGYPVVGSLVWMGREVDASVVEKVRSAMAAIHGEMNEGEERLGDIGVTRLQSGLLCRYRGPSTMAARRCLMKGWQVLRSTYMGRPVHTPRVWQL